MASRTPSPPAYHSGDDSDGEDEAYYEDSGDGEGGRVVDRESTQYKLFQVFSFYALRGNPLEPWYIKASQWKMFCRKCKFTEGTGLQDAQMLVYYTSFTDSSQRKLEERHAGRMRTTNAKKMNFSDFLEALAHIAEKVFPYDDRQTAFAKIINERVLKHAGARSEFDIEFALNDPGVQAMKEDYSPSLKQVFQFYAGVCQTSGSTNNGDKKSNGGVNAMMSSLQFEPFLQFAADFNMTASVLLTTTQISDIFLSSLDVAPTDVERGGLRFEHFWDALVRCAMFAYRDRKHIDPTNKLRALFLYMSVRIEESVPRAINASGRASSSTNAQHLLSGSKRFQFLVTEQWNKDNRKNYLEVKKTAPASAMCMLRDLDLGKSPASTSPRNRSRRQKLKGGSSPSSLSSGKKKKKKKPRWKSATDKKTGKTYYYHTATKEVSWSKPAELK